MESRIFTYNKTALKIERKKMSLLTCLFRWIRFGLVAVVGDMVRRGVFLRRDEMRFLFFKGFDSFVNILILN